LAKKALADCVVQQETRTMRIGDIAAAVVWITFLAGAVSSGLKMGHAVGPTGSRAPFPPANTAIFLLLFFFVASSAGVFFLRRAVFPRGWTGRLTDRVWGEGTWATIVVRLKPTALMIVMCCTIGIIGLASTYAQSKAWTGYFNSAFALSIGLGLAVAYSLSRKYPPTLP
jgi:hypothetical protein